MTTIKTTAKRFNSARQWEIATRLTVRSGNRTDGDASRLKRLRVQVAFHPPDAHRMCRRGCDHSHLICRRFRTWTSRVTYKPACRVARSWSLTVLLFCDTDSFPIVCVCAALEYIRFIYLLTITVFPFVIVTSQTNDTRLSKCSSRLLLMNPDIHTK